MAVSKTVVSFEIETELMQKIIQLNYATSRDAARPNLQSILMDFGVTGVTFAAINGYIIHELQCSDSRFIIEPIKVLVFGSSLETLKTLIKGEDTIKVDVMFNNVSFQCGADTFITKRVDAHFPDYLPVLHRQPGTRYNIYRLPFLLALKRINILQIWDGFMVLKFSEKQLEIHGKNDEFDMSATERLEISAQSKPERVMVLSCSIGFLIDILKNLNCTEIILDIEAENKFVTIEAVATDSLQKEFAGFVPIKPNIQIDELTSTTAA